MSKSRTESKQVRQSKTPLKDVDVSDTERGEEDQIDAEATNTGEIETKQNAIETDIVRAETAWRESMNGSDNFLKIWGVTNEMAAALLKAGIRTFRELALSSEDDIQRALSDLGIDNTPDLSTWITQAGFAAEEDWISLEQYKDELRGETSPTNGGDGDNPNSSGGGSTPPGSGGGGTPPTDPNGGYFMTEPIIFLDMRRREELERARIEERIFLLESKREEGNGKLPWQRQAELDDLYAQRKLTVVDPLFLAVQRVINVGDHRDGKLPSQQASPPRERLDPLEMLFAAIYGILERENATNPATGQAFHNALALARAEYEGRTALFRNVFDFLVEEGNLRNDSENDEGDSRVGRFVSAEQWATVLRILSNQGVSAGDIHLGLKTRQALASQSAGDENTPPSSLDIDLPDLEEQSNVEIIADNLHAMQAVYFASMLEELKLFQVVDKLVELFQYGMLPVSKGRAGDILYRYMKKSVTRFSEVERRNIYARTLGSTSGGESGGNPNRDFQMLWLRFVSSVSSFTRQMQVDSLLRATIPVRVSQEQVRKTGRDLAANLSLYGYGMAYFAATELQGQITEIITLLSDSEIKGAYGARDMWGVVDQVAALELGGARDSIRYRTMATSGAIIVRWLANHARQLASANIVNVLDVNEIANPIPRPPGTKPTTDPFDSDLATACERWLAVTGTPETQVESYADAYESPTITSQPIQIPSVARDMLASVGVSAGLGANGYTNGRGNGYGRR